MKKILQFFLVVGFLFTNQYVMAADTVTVSISSELLNASSLKKGDNFKIPIFCLKKDSFFCNESFVTHVNFDSIVGFKLINYSKVGNLMSSNKIIKPNSSFYEHSLYGYSTATINSIFNFINNSNDAFVFMIIGFNGFWCIYRNKMHKISLGRNNRITFDSIYRYLYKNNYSVFRLDLIIFNIPFSGGIFGVGCSSFLTKESEVVLIKSKNTFGQ